MKRTISRLLLAFLFSAASLSAQVTASVSPSTTSVNVGQSVTFTLSLSSVCRTNVSKNGAMVQWGPIASTWVYSTPALTVNDNGSKWTFSYWGCTGVSGSGATQAVVIAVTSLPPSIGNVSVSPSSVNVPVNGTVPFTSNVSALNGATTAVNWTSTCGTVDVNGNFTAPDSTASSCTITATSQFDPTKFASASVTVYGINATIKLTFDDGSAFTGSAQIQSVSTGSTGTSTAGVAAPMFDATGTAAATFALMPNVDYQAEIVDPNSNVVFGPFPVLTALFNLTKTITFSYSAVISKTDNSVASFNSAVSVQ